MKEPRAPEPVLTEYGQAYFERMNTCLKCGQHFRAHLDEDGLPLPGKCTGVYSYEEAERHLLYIEPPLWQHLRFLLLAVCWICRHPMKFLANVTRFWKWFDREE